MEKRPTGDGLSQMWQPYVLSYPTPTTRRQSNKMRIGMEKDAGRGAERRGERLQDGLEGQAGAGGERGGEGGERGVRPTIQANQGKGLREGRAEMAFTCSLPFAFLHPVAAQTPARSALIQESST